MSPNNRRDRFRPGLAEKEFKNFQTKLKSSTNSGQARFCRLYIGYRIKYTGLVLNTGLVSVNFQINGIVLGDLIL